MREVLADLAWDVFDGVASLFLGKNPYRGRLPTEEEREAEAKEALEERMRMNFGVR